MSEAAAAEDFEPVLPAEVRQQLLAISADLIGRRPIHDLPPGLRRFARFAPNKRLRMGSAELATALSADEDFRAMVADVVQDASPELVEQVGSGTPPATADPSDVGVIAYLFRGQRWAEILTEVSRQLLQANEARMSASESERVSAELTRLGEENAELGRQRDAAKAAAREQSAGHARETAELSHRIRTLQGEARAAQRAHARAEAALSEIQGELERRDSTESAELRRARARIAALEADLEAGRRGARVERDHDDARLWVLLEQLSSAAAGLRRELDIKRPSVTPADQLAGAEQNTGARPSVLDSTLLERMLEGSHVHLIVDGYNITKTGYPELTLIEQRNRLTSSLGALAARRGIEITVAFDGTAAPTGAAASLPTPRGVRVLFSAPGELADDLIRRLLELEPGGRTLVVASSDQAVAASVRGAQAWAVSAEVLLGRIERS
ncbi:NYN domain-containing protein [Jatrophihabitans telluris]|uniref:NYN domain-containing protein n=1 Tax=Jatrophihabitans telluris TaxID=2038343 RepID=A0ABY4QUD1_9ACTN|nr:NYN domain-containing protein [Jatrophihabitans telluris]UQX87244.1 NYN domain-containing protein [Jatrophihabitans telluris]